MNFVVNGKDYYVPRKSLYVPVESYNNWEYVNVEITFISGWDEWMFGLTFLENYYTVYDMEEQRIGFAVSKTSSMAMESTNLLATLEEPELEVSMATGLGVGVVSLMAAAYLTRQCWKKIKHGGDDNFKRADQM